MAEWQPIDTAPKDGTPICLAWQDEDGCTQEWFYPMSWSHTFGIDLGQDGRGIWVLASGHRVDFTWSDADPDGAPTHWLPKPPKGGTDA